jgi:hypothetical protein
MKTFRTFCIVSSQETDKIKALLGGDNIMLFHNDPVKRYWQSIDGKGESALTFAGRTHELSKNQILQNEVLISCVEGDEAEKIVSTIHGGILLAYPDPITADKPIDVSEITNDFNEVLYSEKWYFDKFVRQNHFYFGTLVWKIAREDMSLLYAIEKYKLSLFLDSFTPNSANPKYGQLFENYNAQYSYHTRAAFSIITAFSAIEELGLEIRSSQKNPRFLDTKLGKWNPIVITDINKRLNEIGIAEKEKIDWIFRGNPTRVEEDMMPYLGIESEWVNGKEVRDKSLTFPEAIHNVSYLRNFIAAHKFNELTEFISPYDVFNVQSLTRRLILNKLDLWAKIRSGEI